MFTFFLAPIGQPLQFESFLFQREAIAGVGLSGGKSSWNPEKPDSGICQKSEKTAAVPVCFLPGIGKTPVLPLFPFEGLQTLSCKFRSAERPLKVLSIGQSHQHFSGNFGDFPKNGSPFGWGLAFRSFPSRQFFSGQ